MTDLELRERIAPELDRLARLGTWLAAAEQKDPTPAQQGAAAALRLAYAESLELPLLAATELSIIKGRLVVSAQLLRALAERQGYRTERVTYTETACVARLWHDGQPLGETTFTIEDARRAGLIRERSAWQTHPARMLWARASANVIKDFAPAVSLGLVTEDEASEIEEKPARDPAEVRAPIVLSPETEPPAEVFAPETGPGADFGPIEDPAEEQADSSFQAPEIREGDARLLTEPQRKKIWALLGKLKRALPDLYSDESVKGQLGVQFGTESISELTRYQARQLIDRLAQREQELGL